MRLQIRSRDVAKVTEVLRAHVGRRLGLALGRFAEGIGRVVVRFSEANDHRNASAVRCQIDVSLRPSGRVSAEDTDADVFAVVDHATDRVSRSVALAFERVEALIGPRTSGDRRREPTHPRSTNGRG